MEREIQALKGKSNYTLMHCFIATNDFDKKKKKNFASSYFRLHVIKNAIQWIINWYSFDRVKWFCLISNRGFNKWAGTGKTSEVFITTKAER